MPSNMIKIDIDLINYIVVSVLHTDKGKRPTCMHRNQIIKLYRHSMNWNCTQVSQFLFSFKINCENRHHCTNMDTNKSA